jgi:phosphatidylserine decarboxylase
MWLLYKTWVGRLLLRLPLTWWILTWQHHRIARYANSPESKKSVKPFIEVWGGTYVQHSCVRIA